MIPEDFVHIAAKILRDHEIREPRPAAPYSRIARIDSRSDPTVASTADGS